MNEEEKKKTLAELEVKKQELVALKTKLDELNSIKESAYEKKRKASDALRNLSKSIREAKGNRNNLTKQVRDSKDRRDKLNSELRSKLSEMSKLQKEKSAITSKLGLHIDPSKIKQEIEQLDQRIETEALPFRIEQQIMKKIAEQKKILNQAKGITDVFDRIHKLKKDLDKLRTKADETHKKIQSKASESQQHHEELVESSKDAKDLRDTEEKALKEFVDKKAEYTTQNDLVSAKLSEIRDLRVKLGEITEVEKKKEKKKEKAQLVEKERDVEEKIRKGMTLTTEDLLVFQANEHISAQNKKKNSKKK